MAVRPDVLDHNDHVTDVPQILTLLTKGQKICILQLSTEWKDRGYNKVDADLLWCTDSFLFPGRFAPLVEIEHYQPEGQYGRYRHRLTELGYAVQLHLERNRDN